MLIMVLSSELFRQKHNFTTKLSVFCTKNIALALIPVSIPPFITQLNKLLLATLSIRYILWALLRKRLSVPLLLVYKNEYFSTQIRHRSIKMVVNVEPYAKRYKNAPKELTGLILKLLECQNALEIRLECDSAKIDTLHNYPPPYTKSPPWLTWVTKMLRI